MQFGHILCVSLGAAMAHKPVSRNKVVNNMKRRTLIKSLIKGTLGISAHIVSNRLYAMSDDNALKANASANDITERNQPDECGITPQEIEGPFYPTNRRQEHDIDLTKIEGRSALASGKIITIRGSVMDEHCRPIKGASVEVWQANTWGKYNHPRDKNNPSPSDPDFQGWAVMKTNESGHYRFKTIVPGSYPVNPIWTRPPHIHFKVFAKNHLELITQLYFAGQSLNKHDQLLMRLPRDERARVITQLIPSDDATSGEEMIPNGQFNIVLQQG